MADNVVITSGSGVTIATDDDGTAQHQWVKIKFGGDNSFIAVSTAAGFPVQVLSLPDLGLNSVVKITSLPDLGLNSSVKITSLPAFAVGSSVTISNLASVPLTISGTTIAITSLPDLGLNSSIKITSLPAFAVGSSVTISNLASVPLTISGTTITIVGLVSVTNHGITSLPALGFGGLVSISNLAITISNLATVPLTISGTTIAITSLPDLGLNSSVKITSLPAFAAGSFVVITSLPNLGAGSTVAITSLPNLGAGSSVAINSLPAWPAVTQSITNASMSGSVGNFPVQIIPAKTFWKYTTTTNTAGTFNLKANSGSTTAIYITNIVVSNGATAGNIKIFESSTAIAARNVIDLLLFAVNGGAVMTFVHPIQCDTNTALYAVSGTFTNHSIFASGYTALQLIP